MPAATRGIVLQCTDFSDSSVVAKIYTELSGMQSYLIPGVRSKKSKIKANLFQSLTLVDMVVHHKNSRGLQRISEIRPSPAFSTIPYDIYRSSLAIFINEILLKTIREEESNSELFEFLHNSILYLDMAEKTPANFHMSFIFKLTKYLGCPPADPIGKEIGCFDLMEGTYGHVVAASPLRLGKEDSLSFSKLQTLNFEAAEHLKFSRSDRKKILDDLLSYLDIHLGHVGQLKSRSILEEILD